MVFSLPTHLIYFWRYSFLRFFGFWVYSSSDIYLYTDLKIMKTGGSRKQTSRRSSDLKFADLVIWAPLPNQIKFQVSKLNGTLFKTVLSMLILPNFT